MPRLLACAPTRRGVKPLPQLSEPTRYPPKAGELQTRFNFGRPDSTTKDARVLTGASRFVTNGTVR